MNRDLSFMTPRKLLFCLVVSRIHIKDQKGPDSREEKRYDLSSRQRKGSTADVTLLVLVSDALLKFARPREASEAKKARHMFTIVVCMCAQVVCRNDLSVCVPEGKKSFEVLPGLLVSWVHS